MGKTIWGPNGGWTGKFGMSIGSLWHGQFIQRAYKPQVANPNTDAQKLQRAKFGYIASIAGALNNILEIFMESYCVHAATTVVGQFVKQNIQNVNGSTPESLEINYTELSLSAPNARLMAVMPGEVDLETPLTVKTSIEDSYYDAKFNSQSDTVYLVAYSKTANEAVISDGNAKRNTGSVEVTVPAYWQGHYIESWLVVLGDPTKELTRGKVSPSVYVGSGRIA